MLSHTAILEIPTYDKLLLVSDVAMIPYPDLNQKVQMINYNIKIAAKLGIENPKVAILTANEKVSDKMPCTMEAAVISKMAERKQIKGAIVDGPLALDVAISKHALEVKGLKSPVEGYADILIMPNIEAGNIFYKATTHPGQGHAGRGGHRRAVPGHPHLARRRRRFQVLFDSACGGIGITELGVRRRA